jgi:hypothetical protein
VAVSGCIAPQLARVGYLRFTERFAAAFRKRNIATTPSLPTDLAPQNNVAVTYQTQTGFHNPRLTGSPARGDLSVTGLAGFGTRFKAVFRNIPAGANVYVDTTDPAGKARLTATETGLFDYVSLSNPSRLVAQNGTATAVWEALAEDVLSIEQFEFGVYLALDNNIVSQGIITVNSSLAPVSTIGQASTGPIPRFVDTSSALSLAAFTTCTGVQPPRNDRINPSSATAGGQSLTVTIEGANFVTGTTAQWNGIPLSTRVVTSSQLAAIIPANLIAQPGAGNISVVAPNGARSPTIVFPVNPTTTPFTLSVPALTFQFTGGNGAQTGRIQLGSAAGPAVPFTANASLSTPAPLTWLRVDPTSGVTPAVLTVTVNPAGLKPGVYMASITISVGPGASALLKSLGRSALGDAVVTVTLVISDDRLSFTSLSGGPRPGAKTLTVAALSATNPRLVASASVSTPAGGSWLSINPGDTNAPTGLTVSAEPAGLNVGTYVGVVNLTPTDATGGARQVPVSLTVLARPDQTLTFTAPSGGASPPAQTFVSNAGGVLSAEAYSEGNWLSVSPTNANAPATFSCSVNPAALAPGSYSGVVAITDTNFATVTAVQVNLTVTAASGPTTQVISHIADGAGWKTTIILVNLDSVPAPFTLSFWRDNGGPFPSSLTGRATQPEVSDTIPVGGSRTIETDGTAPALSTGWAQVTSTQAIGGTAVFRDQNLRQEAAVPLLTAANTLLKLPFDTGGLSLGVALANANAAQDAVITRTLRNEQGVIISTDSLPLVRHGHTAFVLANPSNQPGDQRGVLEISSSGGQIYALGIRGNNGAFTSIEALSPQPPQTKVISHIANGARWKTTIVLVNTDTVPVQFTVNFWRDDGSPFTVTLVDGRSLAQVTDAIPVGGSRTIETNGLAPGLSTGWAEVLSSQSISGTAIFRDQALAQEAAVPLLTSGGTRLLLPYDRSLDLGVALANASPSQDASITRILRNEQGQTISTDTVSAGRRSHTAFVQGIGSARPEDQRGVVEFSSPIEFFSLGIRGNNGAFTSVRALGRQ